MSTPSAADIQASAGPHPSLARKTLRVLVADDNRDIVLTMSLLLRHEGHEVRAAYNGSEALRLARTFSFDAMILDIEMPELSGYAVAQEMRRYYYNTRGPLLIALSGKWNNPSEKLLARAVGFDHHVTKPCDPNLLLGLLAHVVVSTTEDGAPG